MFSSVSICFMEQRILGDPYSTILWYPCSFVFNFKVISFILGNRRDGICEGKEDLDSISTMCMTFSLFSLKIWASVLHLQRKDESTFSHRLCRALWTKCYYVCGDALVPFEENFIIVTSSSGSHCVFLSHQTNCLCFSSFSPLPPPLSFFKEEKVPFSP